MPTRDRLFITASLLLLITIPGPEVAKPSDPPAELIELIRANSYEIRMRGGTLEGPGAERLLAVARNAQFVVLAEEHYVREIPQLTTALFRQLQPYGFEYLAAESATVHARLVSSPPVRGDRDAIVAFVRRYPFSITFFSDEEVQMFAEVGSLAHGKAHAVWGIDQEFGVLHVLERILPNAPSAEARKYTQELIRRAQEFELDRSKLSDESHFIAAVLRPHELQRLTDLYAGVKKEEVKWMIDVLVASNRTYNHFIEGRYYTNSSEREEYMKRAFLDEYRLALGRDKRLPRVIVKAGHWHALKGINPAGVTSLGSFLSDLAFMNGLDSYHIALHVHGPEGHWRGIRESEALKIFAEACNPNSFTLVDLRAMRSELRRFRSVLSPQARDTFFKADALLVLGGAQPHTTAMLGKQD
jgi:hypothetical protein